MNHPPFQLTICGVMDLGRIDRGEVTHAISIWHADPDIDHSIRLVREAFSGARFHSAVFDDVEEASDDWVAATPDQVRGLLEFGSELADGHHLLIHCMAGISRSTAGALAILASHLGPGNEVRAAGIIRRLRSQARPNRMVIDHADALLGRDGALRLACDQVFPDGIGFPAVNKGWEDLEGH